MTTQITTHAISYGEDPPKIRIRDLYKSFGAKRVLNGVSLDIPAGTSFVIIGRSGSGKSVLLRCLLGLIPPDSGLIEFDGENILSLSRQRKKDIHRRINHRVGMLFQNAAFVKRFGSYAASREALLAREDPRFLRSGSGVTDHGAASLSARSKRRLSENRAAGPSPSMPLGCIQLLTRII